MRWCRFAFALGLMFGWGVCTGAAMSSDLESARQFHRDQRWQEALQAYREVVERSGSEDPADAAIALNNSCLIWRDLGEFAAAETACREALVYRREADDLRGTARTLNNLALVFEAVGRFEESEERFLEALQINRERDDLESQAINCSNLAELETTRGRYGKALSYLQEIERLAVASAGEPWVERQLALAGLNRGVVFEKLGLYSEALSSYQSIARDVLSAGERGWLDLDLGVVYRNLGDPYLALESFSLAAERSRELGDARLEAFSTLNAGIVLDRSLGDTAAAERRYRTALATSRALGSTELELRTRLYVAGLLRERGERPAAVKELLAVEQEAEAAGFPDAHWQALHGLALVALDEGQLHAARSRFQETFTILDAVRDQVARSSIGDRFPAELRPVYSAAVDCLVRLAEQDRDEGYLREAFELVQRAKRRFESRRGAVEESTVESLQQWLEGAVLIEFFVVSDQLFRWVLTSEELSFDPIVGFGQIARDVLELHRRLSRSEPVDRARLTTLSDRLLAGIPPSRLEVQRIYVAPDGRLGYLPFEILPAPGGETLIDLAAVTYLPSGAALARSEYGAGAVSGVSSAVDSPRWWLAGFANPELGGDELGSASRRWAARLGLGPLPGAERELKRALELLPQPAVGYLGADATESAVRELQGERVAVLHIGAHTVIEEGSGVESAILLAPTREDDGLLLPSEIGRLDLPTDLTVLAGCQTAIGLDDRSSALSDLAAAFLDAGSGGVLATLWAVDDQLTEVFIGAFYEQLRTGALPAEALRRTKQRLRRESDRSELHHWSPYVLIGATDRPPLPRPPRRLWAVVMLAAGLSVLLAASRWWRSRGFRSV